MVQLQINFEIAAIFTARIGEWKSLANSKLYCLSTKWSRSYIVLALIHFWNKRFQHFVVTSKHNFFYIFFVYHNFNKKFLKRPRFVCFLRSKLSLFHLRQKRPDASDFCGPKLLKIVYINRGFAILCRWCFANTCFPFTIFYGVRKLMD